MISLLYKLYDFVCGSTPKLPATCGSRKVVVIGAGYAGVGIARQLDEAGFDVTVVERKEFFYHAVAGVRIPAVAGWESNVALPLNYLLEGEQSRVIQGSVNEIQETDQKVILHDGRELSYDYLVIATGASGLAAFPARAPEDLTKLSEIQKLSEDTFRFVQNAEKILIIGGGPVGVELAAEFYYFHPEKQVTLVHGGKQLLSNANPPLSAHSQAAALEKLKSMNVKVILECKASLPTDIPDGGPMPGRRTIQTSSGAEIETDLIFVCTGNRSKHTSVVPAAWLNKEAGTVHVNDHLQVPEALKGNVFAVGDVADLDETKMALHAKNHCAVVAKNIYELATNGTLSAKYIVPKVATMAIAMGPHDGILEANGFYLGRLGSYVVRFVKGRDYMVGKFKSELKIPH